MKPSRAAPEQYHSETPTAIAQRQRGVTGLETAIILMAFVVVASIYAFTVLSTGIFSADMGKKAIQASLGETSGPVEVEGSFVGEGLPEATLPFGESLQTAVATSSSVDRPGLTADTATNTVAPSVTTSVDIVSPRTSPPPSLILDFDRLTDHP